MWQLLTRARWEFLFIIIIIIKMNVSQKNTALEKTTKSITENKICDK
jgi:hypothetical protein